MPEATNTQMQTFADTRLRVFAEQIRAAYLAAKDHKAAIDDVYARAIGSSLWSDARADGPPHLLAAGGSANPDDVENFNAFVTAFILLVESASNVNVAGQSATWAVLLRACRNPPVG